MDIESNYLKHHKATAPGSRAGPPSIQLPVTTPLGTSVGGASEVETTDEKASVRAPSLHSNAAESDLHTLPDLNVPTRVESKLLDIDPASVGITNHTDVFIHSGTRLCYGILLVVFSMIENPLFSKILYIVGFKGDRERGTRYLVCVHPHTKSLLLLV